MIDRFFLQPNVQVERGTRLRWAFNSDELHNVTLANGPAALNNIPVLGGIASQATGALGGAAAGGNPLAPITSALANGPAALNNVPVLGSVVSQATSALSGAAGGGNPLAPITCALANGPAALGNVPVLGGVLSQGGGTFGGGVPGVGGLSVTVAVRH